MILDHAPDLSGQVVEGVLALDVAYADRMDNEAPERTCYCQTLRWLPFGDFRMCHYCADRMNDCRWRLFEESITREVAGDV